MNTHKQVVKRLLLTDLDVPGFLDSLDELVLQVYVVAPVVRPGHGRDHHVGLRHGSDKPGVVVQRRLHKARALGLEGKQHLELVDVQADLRPYQDERGVPLRQARPHDPAADVTRAAHDKHPAFLHGNRGGGRDEGWRGVCSHSLGDRCKCIRWIVKDGCEQSDI